MKDLLSHTEGERTTKVADETEAEDQQQQIQFESH